MNMWASVRKVLGRQSSARGGRPEAEATAIRARVNAFLRLLSANHSAHRLIADLEEKAGGDYIFDEAYLRQTFEGLSTSVGEMVRSLEELANGKHAEIEEVSERILASIRAAFAQQSSGETSEFILPFRAIGERHRDAVGRKGLRLAQMQNEIGLPVPCGFVITARAYNHFLDANGLGPLIAERLRKVDPIDPGAVPGVSGDLQRLIRACEIPPDLRAAIVQGYAELCREHSWGAGVALRSSALREDEVASFAGQYATELNVSEDRLAQEYREIIASKFSTRAIFYFLTKGFRQEDLAMSVVCQALVPAIASGVLYTVDPLASDSGRMVVNASWGLGQLVVEGRVVPDVYYLDRKTLRLVDQQIACKAVELRPQPGGGTVETSVPAERQRQPALTVEQLIRLGDYGLRLERFFGRPQDVEWAVDPTGGLQILQSRTLRAKQRGRVERALPEVKGGTVLLKGGVVASAGAGSGQVYVIKSDDDLLRFPTGGVLVAAHPSPQLVVALRRAAAVVCDAGGVASHLATLAREYQVPALMGTGTATEVLTPGRVVTVDTDRCCVFAGRVQEVLVGPAAGTSEREEMEDTQLERLLNALLPKIVPLHLVDPRKPSFTAGACQSLHDVTRFIHQAAMNEMMRLAERASDSGLRAPRLDVNLPLDIMVLDLKAIGGEGRHEGRVPLERVTGRPLRAFLDALSERPWPGPRRVSLGGFMAVMAIHASGPHRLEEPCLVITTDDYMNFSVRTGYHYSTVEAFCPTSADTGYVRFHFRGGGASAECRSRRERLLYELLTWSGFAVQAGAEAVDAVAEQLECEAVLRKLRFLGHLTVYTKQLDVMLVDDATTSWYLEEFKKGESL